jgi:hypothetical protein
VGGVEVKILRRILWVVGWLAVALGIFIALTTPDMLARNTRFREGELATTISYVESFRRQFGQLPDEDTFEAWKATKGWDNRAMFLSVSGSLASEDCPFGEIPNGSYGITVWRGEWFECYAAWVPGYSFDDTLKHNIRAMVICALIALAAFVMAWHGSLNRNYSNEQQTSRSRFPANDRHRRH